MKSEVTAFVATVTIKEEPTSKISSLKNHFPIDGRKSSCIILNHYVHLSVKDNL